MLCLEKMRQDSVAFLCQHRFLILGIFCAGAFSFGHELFNFVYGIDEEVWLASGHRYFNAYAANGRWAMHIYEWLLLPGMGFSFIGPCLALIFLSLGISLWLSAHEETGYCGQFLAGILVISFPIFAHAMQFTFMFFAVCCSWALVILAYELVARESGKGVLANLPGLIAPTLLLAFATATYQSLSYLIFAPLVADCLLARPGIRPARLFCRLLIVGLCGLAIYFLSDYALKTAFNVPRNGYLENQIGWISRQPRDIMASLWTYLGIVAGGRVITFHTMPLFGLAALVVLFRGRARGLGALALAICYVAAWPIFYGGPVPTRILLFLPLVPGGLFLAAWKMSGQLCRYGLFFLAVFIFLQNSSINTRLALLDDFARKQDELVAMRVASEIWDVEPDYMQKARAVVFIGRIPSGKSEMKEDDYPTARRNLEVFGSSFWEWDKGTPWRMWCYMYNIGFHIPPLASAGEREKMMANAEFLRMPSWPAQGCVRMIGDVLVIKLVN